MANVAGQAVAVDVGRPFELRGVGVAGADVAGLQLLQLLLRAEFVGLEEGVSAGRGFPLSRGVGLGEGGWTYHGFFFFFFE